MKRPIAVLALLILTASAAAADLEPGVRVRITPAANLDGAPAAQRWEATVLEATEEALLVRIGARQAVVRVPRSSLLRLEVSAGQTRRAGRGAALGALAGAAALLLAEAWPESQRTDPACTPATPCIDTLTFDHDLRDTIYSSGLVVAVGTGLGALVGTQVRSERWREASPRIRIGLAATPRGAAVHLRF
jgi:hypothetical protein